MSKIIQSRSLSKGIVEGEAPITNQSFSISGAFAVPPLPTRGDPIIN